MPNGPVISTMNAVAMPAMMLPALANTPPAANRPAIALPIEMMAEIAGANATSAVSNPPITSSVACTGCGSAVNALMMPTIPCAMLVIAGSSAVTASLNGPLRLRPIAFNESLNSSADFAMSPEIVA